jgi:16S rRNA (cytosine967-C5)-methyltransferase
MVISPARTVAFDVLRRVANENAYAADLLYAHLAAGVKRADASLATELTLGVLRWQRLLDFLLERYLSRSCDELDLEVLLALRIGLYQLRYLDRVPQHAAVNESAELVRRARKNSAVGLINAVLRRAAAEARVSGGELERLIIDRLGSPEVLAHERLAILHSHPAWLVQRWVHTFGIAHATSLLESNNQPASLTCAVLDESAAQMAAESLSASGFEVRLGQWLRGALRISGGDPASSEAYRLGQINLQDEASQMVAHLVDPHGCQSIFDSCAAPGGKTIILARSAGPHGTVFAGDLHEHRLRAISNQLIRTHTTNVRLLAFDATQPWPFAKKFDRVLIDAPCSGTGTLSRNPEIRWRLKPEDLTAAHIRQAVMLRNALAAASPSGRVVYSTCSLEPEENDQVIAEVLSSVPGWRVVSGRTSLQPHLRDANAIDEFFADGGFFRTFPPLHRTDGFFAAVLAQIQI